MHDQPLSVAQDRADRRSGTRVSVDLGAVHVGTSSVVRVIDLSLGGARCVGLDPAGGPMELDLALPAEPVPLRVRAVALGSAGSEVRVRFVDLRTRDMVKLAHALW